MNHIAPKDIVAVCAGHMQTLGLCSVVYQLHCCQVEVRYLGHL